MSNRDEIEKRLEFEAKYDAAFSKEANAGMLNSATAINAVERANALQYRTPCDFDRAQALAECRQVLLDGLAVDGVLDAPKSARIGDKLRIDLPAGVFRVIGVDPGKPGGDRAIGGLYSKPAPKPLTIYNAGSDSVRPATQTDIDSLQDRVGQLVRERHGLQMQIEVFRAQNDALRAQLAAGIPLAGTTPQVEAKPEVDFEHLWSCISAASRR